jgi:hypothetical protein
MPWTITNTSSEPSPTTRRWRSSSIAVRGNVGKRRALVSQNVVGATDAQDG